jgi:molybdopterin converting factor small subunit
MDGDMKLKVKLISLFGKYAKEDEDGLTRIEEPATIRDLAEYLELPIKRVRIMTVNGKQADLETALSDNDEVYIFPPAIGGG